MMFDPEVPAGYQDADIEMAELAAEANELAAMARGKIPWPGPNPEAVREQVAAAIGSALDTFQSVMLAASQAASDEGVAPEGREFDTFVIDTAQRIKRERGY